MNLTNEQKLIIEKSKQNKNLIIKAFAGCGKTSTLIEIAKNNLNKKILYIAFNKSTVEEIKKRNIPKNMEVKTIHSIAYYYIVILYYKKNKKIGNLSLYDLKEILEEDDFIKLYKIKNLFENYCNSNILDYYQFLISENIDDTTEQFQWLYQNLNKIYTYLDKNYFITHSFYLKKFQELLINNKINFKTYDMLLFDEAQDANPIMYSIFKNLNIPQKIIVGDEHQQIYKFIGSINILKENIDDFHNLNLSNSFRITSKTENLVNNFFKLFKNEKKKIKSFYKKKNNINKETNNVILTRTNMGILSYYLNKFLKKTIANVYPKIEVKPYFEPMRYFKILFAIEKRFKYSENITIPEYLYFNNFNDLEELLNYAKSDKNLELISAIKFYQEFELKKNKILLSNIPYEKQKNINLDMFYKYIKNIYQDKNIKNYIMNIHNSKGLEFDNVYLYGDIFPNFFSKIALTIKENIQLKKEEQSFINLIKEINEKNLILPETEEEINLFYVSITRSKNKISCVFETENFILDYIYNLNKNKLEFFLKEGFILKLKDDNDLLIKNIETNEFYKVKKELDKYLLAYKILWDEFPIKYFDFLKAVAKSKISEIIDYLLFHNFKLKFLDTSILHLLSKNRNIDKIKYLIDKIDKNIYKDLLFKDNLDKFPFDYLTKKDKELLKEYFILKLNENIKVNNFFNIKKYSLFLKSLP